MLLTLTSICIAICRICKFKQLILPITLLQQFFFKNIFIFKKHSFLLKAHLHFIIPKSLTTITNA